MSGTLPRVFAAWPAGLAAMLAVDTACDAGGLSPRLLELVRLWCSVLNDCAFCVAMHRRKVAALGVPSSVIKALVERRDVSGFDDGEIAVLAYAAALTDLIAVDAAKEALGSYYGSEQIVILSYTIAQINAWNRLAQSDDV
jgi:AhpD family alkylhydroperoxidase